jgi:hypothetical protein
MNWQQLENPVVARKNDFIFSRLPPTTCHKEQTSAITPKQAFFHIHTARPLIFLNLDNYIQIQKSKIS